MSRTKIIAALAIAAVLALAAFVLLRKKADQTAAVATPAADAADSLTVGRHLFQVTKPDPMHGTLDIFTDGKLVKHIAGINFSLKDFTDQPEGWKNGVDINGDTVPEVLVMEDSGGAHCCTSWRIFHAGQTVEQIYEFNNGHTDFFPLSDVSHDGKYALQVFDWTFAYWKTSFASSPAMKLLYAWQNGTYAFSPELTRTPPMSEDDLRAKAEELKWEESEREAGAPPQFWADMLELIASGNASQLGDYVNLAWASDRPGKAAFLSEFARQLRQSAYWPQLNTLNGGNLGAALPK